MDKYILNDKGEPELCSDINRWAEGFENNEGRVVKREEVTPGVEVSTVFLGLDHNLSGKGSPVLWESMVFGGEHDQQMMDRCSGSREQAEAMHQRMIADVLFKIGPTA
jgi:hypothetical protein